MKHLKVRITRGDAGQNQMVYPERYKSTEVGGAKAGGLEYSGGIRLGLSEEWMLVLLNDALADEYATDPDMEIVSDAEADRLSEEWRIAQGRPVEQVTDSDRMLAIIAKTSAGITLTQEDRDALDPTSDVPGVNRTEKPSERRQRVEGRRS